MKEECEKMKQIKTLHQGRKKNPEQTDSEKQKNKGENYRKKEECEKIREMKTLH